MLLWDILCTGMKYTLCEQWFGCLELLSLVQYI